MNKYLLSLIILLPLATYTVAQEAVEEEMEEIVTTGIKSSLKNAIDIKRKNVGVVDAITAEDLGKFPDANLAEALSRLVGVTTERSNDEGTKVTVRGLGPEFNLVTLNGRTMPTIPPQYGGGRSFNFGDISSHGVAAVEVYKSANAVLPSGGLGSTINMVTAKPIDAKGLIGFAQAKEYFKTDKIKILSIGAGLNKQKINGETSSKWGGVGWLRNDIMGMMLDSEVHHDISEDILGDSYLRINSPLGKINRILDDDSEVNLEKIHLMGMNWWSEFGEKTLKFLED